MQARTSRWGALVNNLVYLLVVVGLSALGLLVLWARNHAPTSPRSSVDQFNDKMRALAPEDEPTGEGAGRPRGGV